MEMDHAEAPENVTDSCETKVKKGYDLEDNSKNQPKVIYKDNGIASNKEKLSMQVVEPLSYPSNHKGPYIVYIDKMTENGESFNRQHRKPINALELNVVLFNLKLKDISAKPRVSQ